MTILRLIACIGLILGGFTLFNIKLLDFTNDFFAGLLQQPKTLRAEIAEKTQQKKMGFFRREILEAQETLELTGRGHKFPLVCAASLLLLAVGASIATLLGNLFLVPVLALGFLFLPFWYVKLTASGVKKDISAELETALSIITTAYLRTEDIITAVEENIDYLNPPVQTAFSGFLTQIKLINPDIESALKSMRAKIDNEVYREWIDALCDCQHDRGLKSTLSPIVAKLSDMRVVNGELENLVYEPRKEFIMMAIFVMGNPVLLYFLNRSWFDTLMFTPAGQFILAVTAALIFVSFAFVIKLTKPIEYKR